VADTVYEISKRCAVGHKLVDQLRADTCSGASMDRVMTADAVSTSRTYTTKLGHQGQDEDRPPGAGRVHQLTM